MEKHGLDHFVLFGWQPDFVVCVSADMCGVIFLRDSCPAQTGSGQKEKISVPLPQDGPLALFICSAGI